MIPHTETGPVYEKIPQEDGSTLHVFEFMGTVFKIPGMSPERAKELERLKEQDRAKEERDRMRRLRDASLMDAHFRHCTFENTTRTPENENVLRLARRYVARWEEVKRENAGLIFYGAPGVGKSHISFCIGNALLDKGISVVAISSNSLLRTMKGFSEFGHWEDATRFFNQLKSASLLILDDLGAEHGGNYTMSQLYEVIDYRYRQKAPMIITTNLSANELREHLTYGGVPRTYDRIAEMCTPVPIEGPPRRIAESERKRAFIRGLLEET